MAIEKYHSACALNCPDICAYIVQVENGRVTRLDGDPDHPYTRGRCCPKGYAHVLRMYSEDRLLYPQMKQSDGTFKRISWDEALDEIADKKLGINSEREVLESIQVQVTMEWLLAMPRGSQTLLVVG